MSKLSIIIPVYNTESYIDRCVNSLIRQIKPDIEILLIDDGSTDNSKQICDTYAGKYEYIKVFHKANGGLASARNKGINEATGQYITFLDSDDWLDNDALTEFLSIIDAFEPDMIGFGSKRSNGKKSYNFRRQPWRKDLTTEMNNIQADMINDRKLFEFGILRSACMHIFKKAIIDKSRLRFQSEREILNEDYLFVTTFILLSKTYYNCTQCFYNYYNRSNSLTTSYIENMYERKMALYKKYETLIGFYSNEEFVYRLRLFDLNNCYECLANQSAIGNKAEVQHILDDMKARNVYEGIRINDQTLKAKMFLNLMERGSAEKYMRFHKLFRQLKKLK